MRKRVDRPMCHPIQAVCASAVPGEVLIVSDIDRTFAEIRP
jgi:hypothetical protein